MEEKKKILEAVGQSSDENIQHKCFFFFFPFFVLVNCFQAKTIKKQ